MLQNKGRLVALLGLITVLTAQLYVLPTAAASTLQPITLHYIDDPVISFDPQLVQDRASATAVENMFVGLTDIDPKTSQIRPEAATHWSSNAAGNVWTFDLRSDIPWVRWDPDTQKAVQVGKVTAHDFEYAIKRVCDPRLGAYYTKVAAALINGCDVVAKFKPNVIKDSDLDRVAVKALSDTQLQITTLGALPYFLYTSSLWMFHAVPQKAIKQYGSEWALPGNLMTNGPFMLDTDEPNVVRVFVKNPLYPKGVNDNYGGNVERVEATLGCDVCQGFDLYQRNLVDEANVEGAPIDQVRLDPTLKSQLIQKTKLSLMYFGFAEDKPPFNNVHVRRAFSAAVNRNAFVTNETDGTGLPIAHLMPPGIVGAVPITEIGVGNGTNPGFDPTFAKSEIKAAGYPNCKGFPPITILSDSPIMSGYLRDSVIAYLGCDPGVLNIQEVDFGTLVNLIDPNTPTDQRPNIFTAQWGADYPDAQNWMHDVLSCRADNPFKRPCTALDGVIDAAGKELNPQKRAQMYRSLEESFFGRAGDFPIIPLEVPVSLNLVKPWQKGLFETDGLIGAVHWDTRIIDQKAQLAARGAAQ